MSGVDGETSEISEPDLVTVDFSDRTHDIPIPTPSDSLLNSKTTSHRIVILYVIGIFLAIVLISAMGYFLKLNYKSWLPNRKHLCDLRDCFKQSNGKKRKFFQRSSNKTKFTIPVVVVSDENGQSLDPDCIDSEEAETKFVEKFP